MTQSQMMDGWIDIFVVNPKSCLMALVFFSYIFVHNRMKKIYLMSPPLEQTHMQGIYIHCCTVMEKTPPDLRQTHSKPAVQESFQVPLFAK